MPYLAVAEQLLVAYRDAERLLAHVDPASAEATDLRAEMARLFDAYERVVLTAETEHSRIPPPFPANAT